jgi:O-antigen ligase
MIDSLNRLSLKHFFQPSYLFTLLPLDLLLLAAAIPLYFVEPAPADYLLLIAVALLGIRFVISGKMPVVSWHDWPFLGYLLVVVVQLVIFRGSASLTFSAITLYLAAGYFSIKYVITSDRRLRLFVNAYLVGAVITVVVMVFQLIAAYSFGYYFHLYFDRPAGLFKDSNVAGPALILATVYSLYHFYNRHNWRWLVGGLVFITGIWLSFSRGAYLGLVGALLLLLIVFGWRSYQSRLIQPYLKRSLIVLLSIVVMWLSYNLYQPFQHLTELRFGTLIHSYDINGREVSWMAGLNGFIQRPFGSGSGSYEQYSTQYQENILKQASPSTSAPILGPAPAKKSQQQPAVSETVVTPSAHNTFIRVLKENGFLGFILLVSFWLWLGIKAVKHIWAMLRKKEEWNDWLIILVISYGVTLPMGSFVDTLHWRHLWYITALLAAVVRNIDHGQAEKKD